MRKTFFKVLCAFFLCFILSAGFTADAAGYQPDTFSREMFGEGLFRSAYPTSGSPMNPVYHWNTLKQDTLQTGESRTFIMTSQHPMTFALKEMRVVERPANLSVDVCPVGLEGYQGPLKGVFLGRSSPVKFTVRVQSSARKGGLTADANTRGPAVFNPCHNKNLLLFL